jgi:hypothetical protein
MKHFFTFLAAFLLTISTFAQVGINNEDPDASAALDITSTTGGLLPPRMTTAQRDAISPAAKGLVLFNTTLNTLQINEGDATTVNWVSLSSAYSKNEVDILIADLQAQITGTQYHIGDVLYGGVVFWLDSTGQHGLVVAMSDSANDIGWGCFGTDLPNVPNVPYNGGVPIGLGAEIGDGVTNTNGILTDCSTAPAALAARSLGPDWFLPSIKELDQIYDHKDTLEAVSGFTAFSNYYWSSTEGDNFNAWFQYFFNGVQDYKSRSDTGFVRAVRAF